MQNVNPYEPPGDPSSLPPESQPATFEPVTARFAFTAEHLVETLARFRSQHAGRRIWQWFRGTIAFLFLVFAIGILFSPVSLLGAVLFVFAAIFLFFPHKIDDYLAIRSLKRTPNLNAQYSFRFTQDEIEVESESETATLKWAAFSKAVLFDDGVLLYRGPKMVNWIPDSGVEDGKAAQLRGLVAAKLPTTNRR